MMYCRPTGILLPAVLLFLCTGHTKATKKDIVFLVDTSGSIGSDVAHAGDFIYNVTKWLTIGPDDIQVSIVTFSTLPEQKVKLSDYSSRDELLKSLKRRALWLYHSEGGTNTAEALEFVGSNSFQAVNGGRRDANRTVVLLTDGESANPTNTVHQAELLKASKNVQIFALGIGTAVSGGNNEIRGIASDPDSYFVQNVDSFLYLCNLVPAMVPKLDPASKATSIANCPTPPPKSWSNNWDPYFIDTGRSGNDSDSLTPVVVGAVVAALVTMATITSVVLVRRRLNQLSAVDTPWVRQYNEAPVGQVNIKFNPASLHSK